MPRPEYLTVVNHSKTGHLTTDQVPTIRKPNHSKTRHFSPVFEWCPKSRPFPNRPTFDHLKTGQVRISDPHCNLLLTRIREELDSIANTKKENRIIITGLTNPVPMPAESGAKYQWLNDMVCSILNKIDPDNPGRILFISHGKNDGRAVPMVEVKIDSAEAALRVRKIFAQKKKNGVDFGRIHVANSVTLATRVQADILRAIAKIHHKQGYFELYVTAYSSRPILHILEKQNKNKSYSLTFVDAVVRFGKDLKEEYLFEAYRRAGHSFTGQLEQHFIVLECDGMRYPPHSGRGGGNPLLNQIKGGGRGGQQRGHGGRGGGGMKGRGLASQANSMPQGWKTGAQSRGQQTQGLKRPHGGEPAGGRLSPAWGGGSTVAGLHLGSGSGTCHASGSGPGFGSQKMKKGSNNPN